MGLYDAYKSLGNTRVSFGRFAEEYKKNRIKRVMEKDKEGERKCGRSVRLRNYK